jgi:hypothetical protein
MPTTTFEQTQTGGIGNFTAYAWSNSANWTNGVPVNGGTVVFNQGTPPTPTATTISRRCISTI